MLDARTLRLIGILSPEQKEKVRKGLIARGVDPSKFSAVGLANPEPSLLKRVGDTVAPVAEKISYVGGLPFRAVEAAGGAIAGGVFHPTQLPEILDRAKGVLQGAPEQPGEAPATFAEKAGRFGASMIPTWKLWGKVMSLPLATQRMVAGAALSAAEAKARTPSAGVKDVALPAVIGGGVSGIVPGRLIESFQRFLSRGKVADVLPGGDKLLKSLGKETKMVKIGGEAGVFDEGFENAGQAAKGTVTYETKLGKLAEILPESVSEKLRNVLEYRPDVQGKWAHKLEKAPRVELTKPEEVHARARKISYGMTGGALSPDTAFHYLSDLTAIRFKKNPMEFKGTFADGLANIRPEAYENAINAYRNAGVEVPTRGIGGVSPESATKVVSAAEQLNRFARKVRAINPDVPPGEIMDDMINKFLAPEAALHADPAFSEFQRANVPFYTSQKVTTVLAAMDNNPKYTNRLIANFAEQRGHAVNWGKRLKDKPMPGDFPLKPNAVKPMFKGKKDLYAHFANKGAKAENESLANVLRESPGGDLNLHDSYLLEGTRVLHDVDPADVVGTKLYRPYLFDFMKATASTHKETKDIFQKFPEFKNKTMLSYLGDVLERRSEMINGKEVLVSDIVKEKLGQGMLDRMEEFGRYVRLKMTEKLPAMNEVLTKYGKNPILLRNDYIPHMYEMNTMTKLFGTLAKAPKDTSSFIQPHTGLFPFALRRVGDYSVADPVTAYLTWQQSANQLIHLTQSAERFNNVLAEGLSQKPMYRDNLISKVNALRGIRDAKDEGKMVTEFISSPIGGFLRELTNDNVQNIIVGNISTILNQSGSLPFLVATCRPSSVLHAIMDLWNPMTRTAILKEMTSKSYNLQTRKIGLEGLFGERAQEVKGIPKFMSELLSTVDSEISAISFASGLRDAQARGLTGEAAAFHADKIASVANRLYIASETPRALRNRFVTLMAPLQGYVLNGYNFLTHDMMRGKMVNGLNTNSQRMIAGAKFLAGVYVTNSIFQSLGIKPPLSTGDFIPFLRGGRYAQNELLPLTGEVSLMPVRTLLNLSSGITDVMNGNFDRGTNKAIQAAMLTIPRGGGLQLWRTLMKGQIIPPAPEDPAMK